MFAIETEGVRIEAATEREAKRALKKALAARDAEISDAYNRREAARQNCRTNGYLVLSRYVAQTELAFTTASDARVHRLVTLDNGHTRLEVTTNNGDGAVEYWEAPRIEGWILNCSGWPLAMLASFCGGEAEWYAVGAAEGEFVTDPLPRAFQPWQLAADVASA